MEVDGGWRVKVEDLTVDGTEMEPVLFRSDLQRELERLLSAGASSDHTPEPNDALPRDTRRELDVGGAAAFAATALDREIRARLQR
jgi:hypothetical protein